MIQKISHSLVPKSFASLLRRLTIFAVLAVVGIYGSGIYANLIKATNTSSPLQLVSALKTADLKQTNGRTNILIAGYSADDAGHAGAALTDSIMILSIKQSDNSAVIISIPRDLYVQVDGLGYSKINAAYQYGEANNFSESGYAAGGMGLLEKTVQQSTGIAANYYGLINYAAFKDMVNAVGGVSVTISNESGVYDPNTGINLPTGVSKLNGESALNLARARGEGYGSYGFSDGDFSRTQYQQQLVLALKDKISQNSTSLNPVKIASLASAIGGNVKTDMSLGEMRALYAAAKASNIGAIQTVTLNNVDGINLLRNYTTASGQSALVPAAGVTDFSEITQALSGKLQ